MNRKEELKQATKFFDIALETLSNKAHDYAQDDDCFSNFKKISYLVEIPVDKVFLTFMTVKIARIVELLKKQETKVGESIQDSLMDMANYSCLMSIFLGDKA